MEELRNNMINLMQNPTHMGEMDEPTGIGHVQSECGDWVRMQVRLASDNTIEQTKFIAYGCGSAIASAEAIARMSEGRSIDDAEQMTQEEVIIALGGLPEHKSHCNAMSHMSFMEALKSCREHAG
ncbi:iron-sulfur cluster assembly scaffold protein [bacterium]|nr:iron-sulfur cluster assembly scaffold protein [bacterium]MCB1221315.1 iron-sulfur cluster assembly scaffold protein [bacterium]UNM08447.1 MAG: iron-sulfur cluster assembly scaffold protein [Planctomycetales bacterium]